VKTGERYDIMRSEMRFANPKVVEPLYKSQPLAIASSHPDLYPQFRVEDFIRCTKELHEALKADREELMKQYWKVIG
jgi:hypothetical protein